MHKHYRRDLLDSLKKTQRNHRMGSIRCVCVCVRENQRASANRKLMHFTIVVDRWIREITKKKERNVDVRHFLAPAERIRDGGAYNRRPNNNKKKKKEEEDKLSANAFRFLFFLWHHDNDNKMFVWTTLSWYYMKSSLPSFWFIYDSLSRTYHLFYLKDGINK